MRGKFFAVAIMFGLSAMSNAAIAATGDISVVVYRVCSGSTCNVTITYMVERADGTFAYTQKTRVEPNPNYKEK
jgi:hypothetical protein